MGDSLSYLNNSCVNSSSIYKPKHFVYFTCSIFWLFIVINTFCFDLFPLDLKIVKCVFLIFKERLLAESQDAIILSSRFMVSFRVHRFL